MKKYEKLGVVIIFIFILMATSISSNATIQTLKQQKSIQGNTLSDFLLHENYAQKNTHQDLGWYTSIAVNSSGFPHISYHDYTQKNLKYTYYNGTNWTTQILDSDGSTGLYTSIALDNQGFAHIAYYDSEYGDLKYTNWDDEKWNTSIIDDVGNVGYTPSIAFDTLNQPHICYFDDDNQDLKHAWYNGADWSIELVESSGNVGYFPSLKIDDFNNLHVAYFDYDSMDLKYAVRNETDWLIQTIDSSGTTGLSPSLALDSNNFAHISYVFWDSFDLKYICYNGTSWLKETIDHSGDIRKWTSIAVNETDVPHICYYDYTDADLKYVYKNASGWQQQTIDSQGSVGIYNSMMLDNENNLHISYYDWGNCALKYAYEADDTWIIQTIEAPEEIAFRDQCQLNCCGWSYGVDDSQSYAQAFKPEFDMISRVDITGICYGDDWTFTLSIREQLDGEDLSSLSVSAATLPRDLSWKVFDFSDIHVSLDKTYYIVCMATETGSNDAFWWYFGVDDPYLPGGAWSKGSGSWHTFNPSSFSGLDFCFKTYGYDSGNRPPALPQTPTGDTTVKVNETAWYNTSTTDPEGDMVFYNYSWGNGKYSGWLGPFTSGTEIRINHSWQNTGTYLVKVQAKDSYGKHSSFSDALFVDVYVLCGDANNDGQVNVGDAVYMINYIFKSGPPPFPLICTADANGDGEVNVADIVYLINFIFKGGPAPVETCCD